MSGLKRTWWGLALVAAACAWLPGGGRAQAASPYLVAPPSDEAEATPAYRYANMSDEEAFAELDRRGVPYRRIERVPGVRAPVRLTGPLHGVHIHSSLPEEDRAETMFEILDARLALALDDFAALLERHDIVELVHYTMYRPNGPKPEDDDGHAEPDAKLGKGELAGKKAKADRPIAAQKQKAHAKDDPKPAKGAAKTRAKKTREKKKDLKKTPSPTLRSVDRGGAPPPLPPAGGGRRAPKAEKAQPLVRKQERAAAAKPEASEPEPVKRVRWAAPGTRHPAGFAIDVGGLRKRDGRWLSVAHHFGGHIGNKTCGPDVRMPSGAEGRELWSIVCEAYDLGVFTYVLTPNYDAAHVDHFHMEIRAGVHWFLYH